MRTIFEDISHLDVKVRVITKIIMPLRQKQNLDADTYTSYIHTCLQLGECVLHRDIRSIIVICSVCRRDIVVFRMHMQFYCYSFHLILYDSLEFLCLHYHLGSP